jgi:phenylacetate-CoA ligase
MKILYPVYRFRQRERFGRYAELMRHTRLEADALQTLNRDGLAAMLQYAVDHVPFYRPLKPSFEAVRRTGDPAEWLACFPVVTRKDLRVCPERFLSDEIGSIPCTVESTAGSTGDPLRFRRDRAYQSLADASLLRSFSMMGYQPGDRHLWVWGEDLYRGPLRTVRRAVGSLVSGRRVFNAFQVTEASLEALARTLDRWRPRIVYGYASSLYFLARWLLQRKRRPPGVRGVMTTAETLDPPQRRAITEAFGAPVFDQYGSREVAGIATQCVRGRMHVFTDMVYLEAMAPRRTGPSRLVVTNLHNRSMPLIRYDIGDEGQIVEASCTCGLPFPLMELAVGRVTDNFVMPSGQVVHGGYFRRLLYDVAGVSRFRFVQRTPECIDLYVVRDEGFGAGDERDLERAVARAAAELGPELRVAVHPVADLPATGRGKFRFTVSEVEGSVPRTGTAGR